MKVKLPFVLIVMVLFFFSLGATLADQSVTFDLIVTVDYPGAASTSATAINDRGDVAGYFSSATGGNHGFVRFSNGHFSSPITEPNEIPHYTFATGINNLGTVCGFFESRSGTQSYFLSGSTFTELVTGFGQTYAWAVNDEGNYCGEGLDPVEAFVSLGGNVTSIAIPGAVSTTARGINNLDQVIGSYRVGTRVLSYRRDADGTLNYPIFASGATVTSLSGINDQGLMVGYVRGEAGDSGIFFPSPGHYALYNYPGAPSTYFYSINDSGLICGDYYTGSGYRSFIVRVRLAAKE